MREYAKKTIKRYFLGKNSKLVFFNQRHPMEQKINAINLYIHIPFCKNMCPYCPYNKIKYKKELVKPYLQALLNEIALYKKLYGKMKIASIYIGGGTPTLLIDELGVILSAIRSSFELNGDICIETSPNNIDDEIIRKLKGLSISLVSVGVQSFNDQCLNFIGRKYSSAVISSVLEKLVKDDFKSINIDLMFALPGQSIADLKGDLQKAIDIGVNQITTYPLFTFPYTAVGSYLRIKKVKMPNLKVRRKQYGFIHDFMQRNGYSRVSVWGFKKGDVPRYSSVTRDNYIGLGAGAGSHLPDGFYLNTFSVEEYINNCLKNKFPTALFLKLDKKLQNYFWLYWRLYDTVIVKQEIYKRFGADNKKICYLFKILSYLNMITKDKDCVILNKKGSFWIHLMQNYFSLDYINRIWKAAMQVPYPEQIVL